MEQLVNIIDACASPALFAPWFKQPRTWAAWFGFLRALFGLPLDAGQLALFQRCTGRVAAPPGGANEAWLIVGRRGGKSLILALLAVFLACFKDWSRHLAPGEHGMIQVIACDRRQARVIFRYTRAMFLCVPALKPLVARIDGEAIELTNGLAIEIMTASFRSVRGYTVIAALLDEIAFWPSDESANPDSEILDAIRPAMATVPGAMLLCASSPYAKRGVLYDAYRENFGRDHAPALVWKADTRTMNPTVPQSVIEKAYERDPASAAAEYGAEFRSDIETFLSREAVDALTVPGRIELPPNDGTEYVAFVDPSGGSSDSMTLAIAHRENERSVLDALREVRPPFSPDSVVEEFALLLKRYRLHEVEGDRYGGEWPRERFNAHGIEYRCAEKPKSDLYRELLPVINSAQCELLDNARLAAQLCSLERRTARGGRDSIDHTPGAHDDLANVAAGALVRAGGAMSEIEIWNRFGARMRGMAA
jgi:hypothetical protein